MRFRQVSGIHDDGKKTYEPGDIIESDIDLVERFGGKFQRVYDDPAVIERTVVPDVETESQPAKSGPGVSKAQKFR